MLSLKRRLAAEGMLQIYSETLLDFVKIDFAEQLPLQTPFDDHYITHFPGDQIVRDYSRPNIRYGTCWDCFSQQVNLAK